MKKKHPRVLVLNADYSAIGLVSWEKAIQAEWKGIVTVVDFYKDDYVQCTSGVKWPVPAVIALKEYKHSNKKKIPFSRKNVFIRDKLCCQYCGNKFHPKQLTFDHVVPRAKWNGRGTPTNWHNIVTACYKCNRNKADKTLKGAGLKVIKAPKEPNAQQFVLGLAPWNKVEKEWIPYLPQLYKDILEIC